MTAEDLFWDLVEPMYADPAVQRSTMMGLPCVRLDGRFFASLDRHTAALLVKLPRERVGQLVAEGVGEPFAPAGRVFREWVAIQKPDRGRWQRLLIEARAHAAGTTAPAAGTARPAGQPAFRGFSPAGLAFLAGLARDNNKQYFDAHRRTFQSQLLEPSKAFVVALGTALQQRVCARLRADPRIGGSLFRIVNDLRFGKDKPPYKPHLDFAFWEGEVGPRRDPALILRITPTEIHLGAGVFALTGVALDRYRTALRDPARAAELDTAVAALMDTGAQLSEPTRVRPPAGFTAVDPAARFAVRDGFHVTQRLPHPATIATAEIVAWCADRLAPYAPIHRWLAANTRDLS
ncbi:DUF2461 family protein [Micromonospora echinaurantiaca]|uniref:DUF2461 family protein n=1 Tax=Micromonospora echinaurantiaca TaxID=47857 RepID=UPI00378A9A04